MSDDQPALRSTQWFGSSDKISFVRRSGMKAQGLPHRMFDGRPVVGICNTWSELTPCNAHLRELAESVKRGVYEAGGLPLEFPVTSLGETVMRPTTMLFRNLVSMDVEESIRANPLDAVVLLGGCDKTTPALVMGASSVDLPTIVVSGGPTLTGRYHGKPLASGTAVYAMSDEVRAGRMTQEEFVRAESCMWRANGHCNTMGTASTMAGLMEVMGLALPGNAAIPAVDSRRKVLAHDSGARAVGLARENLRISDVLGRPAFENAIVALAALGGSTNAVVHLLAIAGRLEVDLTLADFDRLGSHVPLLVDLQPAGAGLMEDFFEAGGVPVLLHELRARLHTKAPSVAGGVLGVHIPAERPWDSDAIRGEREPVQTDAGIAVLTGNLAPDGAVIKPSAASPELLRHEGTAVVFTDSDDLRARIDDPDLDVDADSVLVLCNAGPLGYPGMPEIGNLPIPAKLLGQGVRDMVRISDARMSGTAFGTVVLHVAPESAAGGPLALVRTGDRIRLDVPARSLTLLVPDDELDRRRAAWRSTTAAPASGYARLHHQHVLQADRGADLDFLVGRRGSAVPKESH
ncbi:IlvD/Edd family dehydratase [Amycolatopsis rhabdoformis]|uniref:IlvD/Edd family dehydratase n=1 Tax=Amycolatopsis rhabdoformis TaxID=1448059 RepID=A0ABZ1IKP5_9PSEU|nr:IlvD/Edd family dehydratase [Amycolatopsis rhabdoformis]WSE34760.1 IlvD/Edd family dehydratase [Amycolatopsis rhabdoformis]